MEPGKYENPEHSSTTLDTTLGGEGIPLERTDEDIRRASRQPVPGEENFVGRSGPGPKVMAADTLEGDDIVDSAGKKLGELEHVMIDVPSGRVAYAVLSFGGFLGMGEKLFAIPWKALHIDPPEHRFVLDVDEETLKNAPGFDKDHWPSMADERWATEVHTYYHVRPYWD